MKHISFSCTRFFACILLLALLTSCSPGILSPEEASSGIEEETGGRVEDMTEEKTNPFEVTSQASTETDQEPSAPLRFGELSAEQYTIVSSPNREAALYLQKTLFEKIGVNLPISETPLETNNITLQINEKATSFSLSVKNRTVEILSSPAIGLMRGIRDFRESVLSVPSPLCLPEGYRYENDYGTFITYEQYGAKGDGKTDDITAIMAAHNAANRKGLPVLAREDAIYYIGGSAQTAYIQTDTDWSTAKFLFDDSAVEQINREIFQISAPAHSELQFDFSELKKLRAGATNIGFSLPAPAMLILKNNTVRQFIRKGKNENSGNPMQDVILVDREGNIDPSTPVLWDFDTITSVKAIPMEERTLTLRGGVITTLANSVPEANYKGYYYRGIRIYRSNTVVDGLTHYVENEGNAGSPYYGIIIVHSVSNFTMKNCLLTGHKTYMGSNGAPRGTYDVTFETSTHLRVENCRQTNDISDSTYWGVFASNGCKNIEMNDVVFSRFDAHRGVCNLIIRNSEFGHQGINLIGHGSALIENTTVRAAERFVNLRSDYGSTFCGDLVIRNCTYIPKKNVAKAVFITGHNSGDWNFGYSCYLLSSLTVENLTLVGSRIRILYIFSDMAPGWDGESSTALPHAPILPTSVKWITGEEASAYSVKISPNEAMYRKTKLEIAVKQ